MIKRPDLCYNTRSQKHKEEVMAKWYETGDQGAKKAKQIDEEAKARREAGSGPRRFWLEPDTAAKITFLDTPKFFFHEHNLKLEGRYFNYFTCIKDMDTCPICESGDRSSYVVVGTILSHKTWKDGEGNVHKIQKQLFVARGRARQKLMRQLEKRDEDLMFCIYEMARGSTPTEANTGEDMEFLKKVKKSQVKGLIPDSVLTDEVEDKDAYMKPFDYAKLFKPKTAKSLRAIVGGEDPTGAEEEEEPDQPEDAEEPGDEEEEGEVSSIDDLV